MRDGREWWFTTIYATPQKEGSRVLWEELEKVALTTSNGWLFGGDFNYIMESADKKGGASVFVMHM